MVYMKDALMAALKKLIEQKLGWGDSAVWVNQDFIALSKKIQHDIGSSVSHMTLKRIWGKVNYDGLPQIYTLNTLSQFAGYESWRDFSVKNGSHEMPLSKPAKSESDLNSGSLTTPGSHANTGNAGGKKPAYKKRLLISAATFCFIIIVVMVIAARKRRVNPDDFQFSSHTTIGGGIPNSVVFDYDAKNASEDSVIIQQSWDKTLRTTVSKNQHQHTLIYYYPGFFQPKLLVNGKTVKEHNLLIPSDGWMTAIMRSPVPVYFAQKEVMQDGRMGLSADQIKAKNIQLTPDLQSVSYCNVKDFGPIYSDEFEFETSVKNDFREGSSICQLTNIYLLCEGSAIHIPLCARGCESALDFFFTDYAVSGKEKDLSAFGVNFNGFVQVKLHSSHGKAMIYIDDTLVYTVERGITHSKIIGIDYIFQGTGSVDYVRLRNAEVSFDDEF